MKTLEVAKSLQYPYVWKITMIPLGVNDQYAPRVNFVWKACWFKSVWYMPWMNICCMGTWVIFWRKRPGGYATIIWSGGSATYICSGGSATISVSGDFVTISGSLAAISVVCSCWVGRVVSPHGVRLVRGCYGWIWVGFLHKHVISVLFCYGPMGFILNSVLG